MPSVTITIPIEVEIAYEERKETLSTDADGNRTEIVVRYEPKYAEVVTAGLPTVVENFMKVLAIERFEENPLGCPLTVGKGAVGL